MDLEQQNSYQLAIERANDRLANNQLKPGEKPEKMGWGLFLFGLLFCIIGDLIDLITAGTLGWLIGLFIDFVLLLMFGLSKSGRKQWKKWLTGLLGESVPIVATLPLRTIFLLWSFASSRNTKLQAVPSLAKKING